MSDAIVYLVPSVLDENAIDTIPAYVLEKVKTCTVIFAENERTVRRFLKALDKTISIDNFEWHTIHKIEEEQLTIFSQKVREGKTIAIISEAGCPGIADPGQILINRAQQLNATIKPLVGPSAILLALMASGLSGQQFSFNGYLPIENSERNTRLKALEDESAKKNITQLFIETPYRNNPMLEAILKNCKETTLLSIAADITGPNEFCKTKTIAQWKKDKPELHKRPAIFLIFAGKL